MKALCTIHFPLGYIADPYWTEVEKVINIQKESGMNRMKGSDRRAKALDDYLHAHGLTMADYDLLVEESKRPWYTWATRPLYDMVILPLDGHDPNEIIVPAHHMHGALANASDLATSSIRISKRENIRVVVRSSDFATSKHATDAMEWERFARHEDTNQRGLRTNYYLPTFDASGEFQFSPHHVDAKRLYTYIEYVGRDVGVGASRKMGWGRFEIKNWKVID